MNDTMDPRVAAAMRRALVEVPTAARASRRRRTRLAAGAAIGVLSFGGGAVAVANLLPADQVADLPLTAPLIVSGVGSQEVRLPAPPGQARYVHYELTCFDSTTCGTPAGRVSADTARVMTDRGNLPVTDEPDPTDPQRLDALDPARGLPVRVDGGARWRLYAVYLPQREMRDAPVGDGRRLGVPSVSTTDLVPAVTGEGRQGWIEYRALVEPRDVELTADGVTQPPLPVYAGDGVTVIGQADVSATVRGRS
ncbi:MAG: hypothetical protein U0Q15_09475 [Kineosporiaceae bacterium]